MIKRKYTVSILIMAFTITPLWASNECGLIINESVTCNGDGIPVTDASPYNATQGVSYSIGLNQSLVVDVTTGASPFTILDNGGILDGGISLNMGGGNISESITLNIDDIEMTSINDHLVSLTGGHSVLNSSANMAVNSTADLFAFLPVILATNAGGNNNYPGSVSMNVSGEIVSFGAQESAAGIGISNLGAGDVNVVSAANFTIANSPFGSGIVSSNSIGAGNTLIQSSGTIQTVSGNGISVSAGFLEFGNTGTSDITIESTGDMSIGGMDKSAIRAAIGYGVANEGGDGDINITASGTLDVTGDDSKGINAEYQDQSTGTISIDSSADINLSGDSSRAFNIENELSSFDLDLVTSGNISTSGNNSNLVRALSLTGDSNLNITTNGIMNQTGNDTIGVFAQLNQGNGDITINAHAVLTSSQLSNGIFARHGGASGNISININEDMTLGGEFSKGILCTHLNSTTGACNLNLNAGKITTTGDSSSGVEIRSLNGSMVNITSNIDIENQGSGGRAIDIQIDSDNTVYDIDITGGNIVATNNPTAAIRILSSSNVSNGVINISNALLDASLDNAAIQENNGATDVNLNSGSEIKGRIELGEGTDSLSVLTGSNTTNVTLYDGGDDFSDADGFVDALLFSGVTNSVDGSTILNWENMTLDNTAQLTVTGGTLKVGENLPNLGTSVLSSSTFDADNALAYQGNFSVNTNSTLEMTGAGTGIYSISGDFSLINATLNANDNNAGDVLSIAGNYSGTGSDINLDVVLGDSSSDKDLIVINGDAQGIVTLNINNVGGLGAATGNNPGDGIKVLQVDGTSNLVVLLQGGVINTPQYSYNLVKNNNDGSWYLQSLAVDIDVSVVKDLITPGPYHMNDEILYQIVVSNAGPNTANDIVVNDVMTNLNLVSMNSINCLPNTFPCTIASLASGASETIMVTTSIVTHGAFDNQVTVSANEIDTDTSNNSDNNGNGGFAVPFIIPTLSWWSMLLYLTLLLTTAYGFRNRISRD